MHDGVLDSVGAMAPVRVTFEGRAQVVPLHDGAKVRDLLALALGRFGAAPSQDDPFVVVLTSDKAELEQDDLLADVLMEPAVTVLHASQLSKRTKANDPMEQDAGPPPTLGEGNRLQEIRDDAPLRVLWSTSSGEHGAVSLDPSQSTLSTLARQIEGQLCTGDGSTVELYADRGHALGSSGPMKGQPLRALGWAEAGDVRVYAVRTWVDRAEAEPQGTADPNDGRWQLFVKTDRTYRVCADPKDRVSTLKLKVKAKIGTPIRLQRLIVRGKSLVDDSMTLHELGIQNESTLTLVCRVPPQDAAQRLGAASNFSAALYEPLVPQSANGLAAFFASLRVLSRRLDQGQRRGTKPSSKLLGALRRLTDFPPLVAAMYEVLDNRSLSQPQRVALVEGLYALFRRIAPTELLPGGVSDHAVFEASLKCWAWLLGQASDADAATEKWETVRLECAISWQPIEDLAVLPPDWWRPDWQPSGGRACSRAALLGDDEKLAARGSEAPALRAAGTRRLRSDELLPAPEINALLAGHATTGAAVIWQQPSGRELAFPPKPPALQPPSGDAWGTTLDHAMNQLGGGMLRVKSAVELKGHLCRAPALTRDPGAPATLCVFVEKPKSATVEVLLFHPLTGDETKHDLDELAARLSDGAPDAAASAVPRVSRPPQEAIVVLFDKSNSMARDGFGVPTLDFDPVSSGPPSFVPGEAVRVRLGTLITDVDDQELDLNGVMGEVQAPIHGACTQDEVLVRFRSRRYGNLVVRKDALEALTARGVAALLPISRMETAKQLFAGFANRSMAYNLPHVIGLTTFSDEVKRVRQLTEAFESFNAAVAGVTPQGATKLYDALEAARLELREFCGGLDGALVPSEGVRKRVLVLTDGTDSGSTASLHGVCAALQADGVVVDSVVIGEAVKQPGGLRSICVATGGCAFHPASMHSALRLFETETVLSLRRRAPSSATQPKSQVSSAEELRTHAGGRTVAGWDEPPAPRLPDGLQEGARLPSVTLDTARNDARGRDRATGRHKRILRELAKYVRDPHPRVEVFPAERQLDLWQLLLKGPDDTPYADGTFVLWIRFPEDFPLEAPEVRFSTPVHHCNINSHGKVCHSIFDRNWVADTTVRQVLDCVYGLLLVPEPDDPLDSVLALQYLSKRDEYNAAAASLTRKHALDAYAATRSKLLGEEQAGSGAADSGGGGGGGSSSSSCDSGHPPHLVCKITCALFDEPVTTQHGHTFSRAALLEMLRRKPACPVTGKPLSVAKVEALSVNIALRDAVGAYKRAAPWWDEADEVID